MTEMRSKTHEEHSWKVDREMSDLSVAYRAIASKVESSDLTLKVLGNRRKKIENFMNDMNQKYEMLVAMMAQINGNRKELKYNQAQSFAPQAVFVGFGSNRVGLPHTNQARKDTRMHTKLPKIDFSYFNGDGPKEWVMKARKYFQLH
ncbi:Uncharacterized protein Adt_36006 [Abeliophyllum distichum]|uniref:Uncharacterized protein n=1 Tax=Abeliophyllum distichum TaxID=126358 RepID=A0ABD1QGB7_9LAMI